MKYLCILAVFAGVMCYLGASEESEIILPGMGCPEGFHWERQLVPESIWWTSDGKYNPLPTWYWFMVPDNPNSCGAIR